MNVARHRRRWSRGLLTLAIGSSSVTGAHAGTLDAINAMRLAGCAGRPGVTTAPLRSDRQLNAAARHLADGDALAHALATAGYQAMLAASVHVRGEADDAAVARRVAEQACVTLVDPSVTQIGAVRTGIEVWVILAAPFPTAALQDVDAVGRRVVELANAARAEPRRCGTRAFGRARPLRHSAVLNQAARAHSVDMAARDTIAHDGADGSGPGDRVTRAGYRWRRVAENVASGIASPEAAMKGWLSSAGHCANLMDPQLTETGVGYVVDPSSDGRVFWTQVFAAPAP